MFPNDIEDKVYGSSGQKLVEGHIQSHEVLNDALTAVETKVGVDGSEDTNSIDYKLNHNVALLDEADGVIDSNYIPSSVVQTGSDGKIPVSVMPAITIGNNTYIVDTEEEMLALDAIRGDVCIRNDNQKTYLLMYEPASVLANWHIIETVGQVLYKATANDVKTGTDDEKYITSKSLKDSQIIPKVSTDTFPANETTYTINVSGLTANDLIGDIAPQTDTVGTWRWETFNGYFTITSDKTETSAVNFAYFIIKQ